MARVFSPLSVLILHRLTSCFCTIPELSLSLSCSCSRHSFTRIGYARRSSVLPMYVGIFYLIYLTYLSIYLGALQSVLSDDRRVWRSVPAGRPGQPQHHRLLPEWRVLKRTGTGRRRSVSDPGGWVGRGFYVCCCRRRRCWSCR